MTRTDPTRPRVLLLTHRLPYPPDRGDRIRSYHLLRGLAERCNVTLASVCDEPPTFEQLRELRRHTTDLLFQHVGAWPRRLRSAAAMARGAAATPAAHLHRGLAARLIERHRARPFDTVVTFCTGMAGYADALRDAAGRTGGGDRPAGFREVVDLVDVDSAKWARYARGSAGPTRWVYAAEARRLRRVEREVARRADAVSVISAREARVFARAVTRAAEPVVAGNGVDTEHFSPGPLDAPPSLTCVFTGVMSYRPNVEAAAWFAERVLPLVRAAVPGARFEIVGKAPAARVMALRQLPGVVVTGAVADTRPHLRRAAVSVAPLRIAPGVQNKVLEAMACGLSVVCSPAAARGIDAQPGRDLLVAGGVRAFAEAVVALLQDPARARSIGRAARERVAARHAWTNTLAPLLDAVAPPARANTDRQPPASAPARAA